MPERPEASYLLVPDEAGEPAEAVLELLMKVNEHHAPAALLVDYGGVLTSSVAASFVAFCRDEDIPTDVFKRAVFDDAGRASSAIERIETGAISSDEFDVIIARRLSAGCGRVIEPAGLKQRLFARVQVDEKMLAAVERARANGFATVLVSNSWGDEYPMDALAPLFDDMLISGRIGLRKPNSEIYLAAARAARAPVNACVFVDDLQHNIEGAEAVGMTGLLHRTAAQTIGRLEALFGVSLSG